MILMPHAASTGLLVLFFHRGCLHLKILVKSGFTFAFGVNGYEPVLETIFLWCSTGPIFLTLFGPLGVEKIGEETAAVAVMVVVVVGVLPESVEALYR